MSSGQAKVRLSLFLSTWASDLVRRARRLDAKTAIVLTRKDHGREVIGACCAVAARAGVRIGITAADAQGLLPAARTYLAPLDPESDARRLLRLAEWSLRAVPIAAIDPPDGLLLDASGCEQIYGGIERLVARLYASLRRFGLAARLVAAPTWGAAWALARFGDRRTRVVSRNELREAIFPLPIASLRLAPQSIEDLHRVGVESVGHLGDLPREALADRYGPELLLRFDQAFGLAEEPISPIRPREPVQTERDFDGPTCRLEDIERAVRLLVDRVCEQLEGRGKGCRRLEVTLRRSDLPPLVLTAKTARPTRDARHLWKLVEPACERAQLGFGVEGVRVAALALASLAHAQQSAWGADEPDAAAASEAEIGCLVDTLTARLGHGSVRRMVPVESHAPERSFVYEPVESIDSTAADTMLTDMDRPSLLYDSPVESAAMLLVPDGPVSGLRIDGRLCRVVACVGPERVEPEWWRGEVRWAARDYFKVQLESGRWLWAFRESQRDRWFIHGEWA